MTLFPRLFSLSSGTPPPTTVHWFFKGPTPSRVYFCPLGTCVCLPKSLWCLVITWEVYLCLFSVFVCSLLMVFRCFPIAHLMNVPPTGHIWCLCLLLVTYDVFVSFWTHLLAVSFWFIIFVRILSCYQFWQSIWWSCLVPITFGDRASFQSHHSSLPCVFEFHSVSIPMTHQMTVPHSEQTS